ncbi:MAG: hypothetical protein KF760_22655 [Candidatus Eremiobacteraeota bacterium]|nr:hypothetical protein [Candidatus Eremiobacteraeota bacterium]MCW5868566.1 hypothetical protein [Candidatus Eremiobacteraeota bacterium]
MHKEITFKLEAEVADWLAAQPEGGAAWITRLVREQLKTQAPPPEELSGEARRALALAESLEPAVRQRLQALIRYPQLVDAVARGYVSVERAEEMAEEADARKGY